MSKIAISALLLVACSDPPGARLDGSSGFDGGLPVVPSRDPCGNGYDDDGNGRIDDGCTCAGEEQACWSGELAQRRAGACRDGVQRCVLAPGVEWGDWGDFACEGESGPSTEACDGLDNDCDGATDEMCPCEPGGSRACGEEFIVAPCRAGTMRCRDDGTWSGCEGAIGPSPDVCDGADNDCDSTIDEGCVPMDAGVPPDAGTCTAEWCDGMDNDCDGIVDEGCGCEPAGTICPGGETSVPGAHAWDVSWSWDDASAPIVMAASSDGMIYEVESAAFSRAPVPPFIRARIRAIEPDGTTRFTIDFGDLGGDPEGEGDAIARVKDARATPDGVYALVAFQGVGVVTFAPGETFRLTGPYATRVTQHFIAAYDPDGNFRFATPIGPKEEGSSFHALHLELAGGETFYVAGTISGSTMLGGRALAAISDPGPDTFVAKIDRAGTASFVRVIPLDGAHVSGGRSAYAYGMTVDPASGDPFVLGQFNRATDFGDAVRDTGSGSLGTFVVRLDDASGATEWSRVFIPAGVTGTEYATVQDVAAGPCGVRVSVTCRGQNELAATTIDCGSAIGNGYLVALAPDGTFDWSLHGTAEGVGFGTFEDLELDAEGRTHAVIGIQKSTYTIGASSYPCPRRGPFCTVIGRVSQGGTYLGGRRLPGGANYVAVDIALAEDALVLHSTAQTPGVPVDLGSGATCEHGESCFARYDLCTP
jgi:hypothetical protein